MAKKEFLSFEGLQRLVDNINEKFNAKADKKETDALGKRINNLILSSGTESSAEVVDARTGYDGTAHDTLGTAIRNQVSELKSDLDDLDSELFNGSRIYKPLSSEFNWEVGSIGSSDGQDGTYTDSIRTPLTDGYFSVDEYNGFSFKVPSGYKITFAWYDGNKNYGIVNPSSSGGTPYRSIFFNDFVLNETVAKYFRLAISKVDSAGDTASVSYANLFYMKSNVRKVLNSVNAEKALNTDHCDYASNTYADIKTIQLSDFTIKGYGNSCRIDSYENNRIVATTTSNWGTIQLKKTLEIGKTYGIIFKSTIRIENFGFVLSDGSGYNNVPVKTYNSNNDIYYYADLTVTENDNLTEGLFLYTLGDVSGVTVTIDVQAITDYSISKNDILYIIGNPTYNISREIFDNRNLLKGKNVLVCGDSLTAALKWQKKLEEHLGMNVTTHAIGGAGTVKIMDGGETSSGTLEPLTVDDVTNKDVIIWFSGTNDMNTAHGQVGDLYPTNKTVAGCMQYVINKLYALLESANNLGCRVIVVTPFCYGALSPNPTALVNDGSGLAEIIEKVAHYNGLPCYNAYNNSGINQFTWAKWSSNIDGDQLHLSTVGYAHLGNRIAEFLINNYKLVEF